MRPTVSLFALSCSLISDVDPSILDKNRTEQNDENIGSSQTGLYALKHNLTKEKIT